MYDKNNRCEKHVRTYVSFPLLFFLEIRRLRDDPFPFSKGPQDGPDIGEEEENGTMDPSSLDPIPWMMKRRRNAPPSIFLLARVAERALHENIFVRLFFKKIYLFWQ